MSSVMKMKKRVDVPPNNNSRRILEEDAKCDNDEKGVDGRPPKAGGRLVILKKAIVRQSQRCFNPLTDSRQNNFFSR